MYLMYFRKSRAASAGSESSLEAIIAEELNKNADSRNFRPIVTSLFATGEFYSTLIGKLEFNEAAKCVRAVPAERGVARSERHCAPATKSGLG